MSGVIEPREIWGKTGVSPDRAASYFWNKAKEMEHSGFCDGMEISGRCWVAGDDDD